MEGILLKYMKEDGGDGEMTIKYIVAHPVYDYMIAVDLDNKQHIIKQYMFRGVFPLKSNKDSI